MKTLTKLFMSFTVVSFMGICALEKPADINPVAINLKKEVDEAKKAGKLSPLGARARELETKRLKDRYLQLGLKQDKTQAEQEEFKTIAAELRARIGTAIDWLVNN